MDFVKALIDKSKILVKKGGFVLIENAENTAN
jgi:hypothetical protein